MATVAIYATDRAKKTTKKLLATKSRLLKIRFFIVLVSYLILIKNQALFEQPEHQTQAQINRGEKAIDQYKGQKQVVHRQISHAIKPVIVLHLAVRLVELAEQMSINHHKDQADRLRQQEIQGLANVFEFEFHCPSILLYFNKKSSAIFTLHTQPHFSICSHPFA